MRLGGSLAQTSRSSVRRRVYLGILVSICFIVISFAWMERPAILRSIGDYWVVSDPLEPADAAAVLGGGIDTRPRAAAALYRSGLIKQIVVFNQSIKSGESGHSDREELLRLGVPTQAIAVIDNNVSNTYEEAKALAHWAGQNQVKRIIVPTEIFPSRRVQWILRREVAKYGIHAAIETGTPIAYNLGNWWHHKASGLVFLSEFVKYAYYRLRY